MRPGRKGTGGRMRRRVAVDRPWADAIGSSRAVRVGDVIEVGGTAATNEDGSVQYPGMAYEQAREVLTTISRAIAALGGEMADVVRTRVYLVDIRLWPAAMRAHAEAFANILPATTVVETGAPMMPGLVLEIEATAVVGMHANECTQPFGSG